MFNPWLSSFHVGRELRRLATGLCFLTFISVGGVLTVTALPLILLLSRHEKSRETMVLRLIRFCFKSFMRYMQLLRPIATFKIEGHLGIQSLKGCMFIANHPSLIDVVALLGYLPLCQCIVKKSLLAHFYLGGLMRAAGYIANDNEATQLIADCQRSLQAGRSLLIFPEGTRSPAGGLRPFSRGAAQIALRTRAPIIPIVITCDPPTLLKGEPWYAVPERPMNFVLRFHEPFVIPHDVLERPSFPLQVRALNQYFEDFFRRQLSETNTCQPVIARPPLSRDHQKRHVQR